MLRDPMLASRAKRQIVLAYSPSLNEFWTVCFYIVLPFTCIPLFLHGNIGPFVLYVAAAVNISLKAPLGAVLDYPIQLFWNMSAWLMLASLAVVLQGALGVDFYFAQAWKFWILPTCLFFIAVLRRTYAVRQVRSDFEELAPWNPLPRPKQPWLACIHPYFYKMCSLLPGVGEQHADVTIIRHHGNHSEIWLRNGGHSAGTLPILFFIRGGGWLGNADRQTGYKQDIGVGWLLHTLAASGWFVVAVEYRMVEWPQQIDDCMEALKWVCGEEARSQGADCSNLFVMGESAGGHLASLVVAKAHCKTGIGSTLQEETICPTGIKALVLYYPALDPGDQSQSSATLMCLESRPFDGESVSCLSWYFEKYVLQGKPWDDVEPLALLRQIGERAQLWPPTLVVHGTADGVVALGHTSELARCLEEAGAQKPDIVWLRGCRHAFDVWQCCITRVVFDGTTSWMLSKVS